jgi:hypothetical protein
VSHEVTMKFAFTPIGIAVGLLAGQISRKRPEPE